MTPLLPGESIRWQGRPAPGVRPRTDKPGQILFGLAFTAFALFWMRKAGEDGGLAALFGLPFLFVGLRLSAWYAWEPRLRAKFAHYTVTNRRAIVETRWPLLGVRVQDMTLTPDTIIDTDGEDPATISLRQSQTGPRGTRVGQLVLSHVSPGFDAIQALRNAQREAAR